MTQHRITQAQVLSGGMFLYYAGACDFLRTTFIDNESADKARGDLAHNAPSLMALQFRLIVFAF